MPEKPGVTFIIPVLNGDPYIARCLRDMLLESRTGDQVVVVDNGSRDRTVEIVEGFAVELLSAPGVTIAALRNLGAARARHDILAFIDADCIICPGWRSAVERVLSDSLVAAVGSYYDIPERPTWVERAWWSFRPKTEHLTSFLISGNFAVRREAFDLVGGFNSSLVTDEDTDISRRLIDAGMLLIESPAVRVIHLGNAKTLRQFYRKEHWHATSVAATMRNHGIDRSMWMTFAFFVLCIASTVVLAQWEYGFATPFAAATLFFAVPSATALLKAMRYQNYRFVPELTVLFSLVFVARSVVVLRGLVDGPSGRRE